MAQSLVFSLVLSEAQYDTVIGWFYFFKGWILLSTG